MNRRAVVLVSGGLDSTLALLIVKRLGVEPIPLHISTPFNAPCCRDISFLTKTLEREGIKLVTHAAGMDYVELVKKPKYGYGRAMNPCIDCRIYMFKVAKEYMKKYGADFIVTGEVLGQRPKSQSHRAIKIIEEESGLSGLVLRPLSAKLLPETEPEKQGVINRDALLSLSGRSRKDIIRLAREMGLEGWPNASGGCLLAYEHYAAKLKDLFKNETSYTIDDILLLKVGRHFRLAKDVKLILGRNAKENAFLEGFGGRKHLKPVNVPGPTGLLSGPSDEFVDLASRIVAAYSDRAPEGLVVVSVMEGDKSFEVKALQEERGRFASYLITPASLRKEKVKALKG